MIENSELFIKKLADAIRVLEESKEVSDDESSGYVNGKMEGMNCKGNNEGIGALQDNNSRQQIELKENLTIETSLKHRV